MGFISWQTADTQESVWNAYTHKCRTVYLLQPCGKHIKEEQYQGYGVFSGVETFEWLAKANAEHLGIDITGLEREQLRVLGIKLVHGDFCMDTVSGEYWVRACERGVMESIIKAIEPSAIINIFNTWEDGIPRFDGATVNELLGKKLFSSTPISGRIEIKYPIKLSFSPNAVYDNHPASKCCPYQGYFISDDY